VRPTHVIGMKCFLTLLFSAGISFAVEDSAADTTVPWVPVKVYTSRAAAAPATAISAGDTAAKIRTRDTAAVPPQRELSGRDSLLDSILTSLDSAKNGVAGIPKAASTAGVSRRPTGILPHRAMEFSIITIRRIRHHPFIALTAATGFALFLTLWVILKRRRVKNDEKRFMTTTRLSLMDGEVQRACLHIEKRYMDPSMTPASVCGSIVTGQPFLETMFERELGMSVAAYIDQVRTHHARQIVQWNPAAEAAFIAEHTGYSNAAEFVKQFKKVTGNDFYDYRNEKQKSTGGSA
jgi:AraC-like DNA-binding protein